MNSLIRLESKKLLSRNTAKLFFVSFFSFVLRYGVIAISSLSIYVFYNSALFSYLKSAYNVYLIYSFFFILCALSVFFTLLFISSIKLGECFAFFTRANGGSSRITPVFKFLKLSQSIKALSLYFQINFQKLLWFIYFSLPLAACVICIYYLISISFISKTVYFILSAGASIIFAFILVMIKISSLRLSAAPYYLCLQKNFPPSKAIKKSIRFTDGFLTEGAILEYSLLGWILSCFSVIPLFYVIPYIKLTKAIFITEAVFSRNTSKTNYAINILKLA